jgi:uncharacterized protein (TIGR02145 family)
VNGTGSALTFSEAATTAGIFDYTVQRMSPANMQCEMLVSNMRSITVNANPVISAQPAAVSVCPGSTVTLSVTASPVTAYRWRKNGSATSEGSNYTSTAYTTVALIAGTTYSVVVANSSCSVTSNNAVVTMKTSGCGIDQPQGSCTYTVPAVISTFAAFPSNYSASTYVSLTDERDSKNYPVVKIGSRWIMARNLNYQGTNSANTLTWQTNAAQPSTGTGSNTALIGHFWCPGAHGSATSTRTSCEVWGALYSWETAMMVDGKWSDDNRNSTAWSNPVVSANTVSGNTNNGGKGANNHGICPPNWHVPTDGEWGDVLNAMETDSKNHNASTGWLGTNAGTRGKSKCGGTATDANAYWSSGAGTDDYGFRVLPTDDRNYDGSAFAGPRGSYAQFWSSSAYDGSTAWRRDFSYSEARVVRDATNRSYGYVVRCIRD